jgi:hypothetical protein
MKRLPLVLLLALSSCSATKARFPSSSDQLPSTYHRHGEGEGSESNACWVVKIDSKDFELQRYFVPGQGVPAELTQQDLGKFTVLGETHLNGFGGDGYPKLVDRDHPAMSYDDAVNVLQTNERCQ